MADAAPILRQCSNAGPPPVLCTAVVYRAAVHHGAISGHPKTLFFVPEAPQTTLSAPIRAPPTTQFRPRQPFSARVDNHKKSMIADGWVGQAANPKIF
ncbi:MAG: hypothetical protein B7Z29_03845 [Hyphomicrobium sp. 12-62-95]|nr:MAG: hypothetical protein B7Z29_03845 [Hyphomicrobium sp. 12-62-95]